LGSSHEAAFGESESEQFFGALANLAQRGASWATAAGSPQRRFALWAARQALNRGLPALGRWAGSQVGGSTAGTTGASLGNRAASWLSGLLPQQEYEAELEWQGEISPVRKWYPDAMLEHMGHAMAEAETEAEAEALAGALIPLVARAVPQSGPAVMRAMPGLVCGVAGVVRGMHRSPATRPLVRVIPGIVRRTATIIGKQAGQGTPVTPQTAVRTLARQTYQVLSRPQAAARTFRNSQHLDQRFHRATGAGRACPSCGRRAMAATAR
jgi:hypothetical protein